MGRAPHEPQGAIRSSARFWSAAVLCRFAKAVRGRKRQRTAALQDAVARGGALLRFLGSMRVRSRRGPPQARESPRSSPYIPTSRGEVSAQRWFGSREAFGLRPVHRRFECRTIRTGGDKGNRGQAALKRTQSRRYRAERTAQQLLLPWLTAALVPQQAPEGPRRPDARPREFAARHQFQTEVGAQKIALIVSEPRKRVPLDEGGVAGRERWARRTARRSVPTCLVPASPAWGQRALLPVSASLSCVSGISWFN